MISLRYLFEKRRERFISVTALISVMGIAVGVAALIVTMGIVNGFDKEIEEKLLSVNPHIIVGAEGMMDDPDTLRRALSSVDGVTGSSKFLDGQALISVDDKMMGILVRGVAKDPAERLIKIEGYLKDGSAKIERNGVIIGSELARLYRLKVGEGISIISPVTGKTTRFKVGGIFNSGRYDYDLNLVFLAMDEAAAILQAGGAATGIGLMTEDAFKVDRVKRSVQSLLRPPFRAMTWKEIDKNLFSALKLEKIVLFLVVALIVFVACFNIISTLIMTVMEKTKDIGILKAIGVTRRGVMSVFFLEGLYVSVLGIILGAALGLGVCYLQAEYELVRLPADVYYIYSVPIHVRVADTLLIIASAFVLGLLATVYPSYHAGRLNTVDVLRCG